MSVHKTSDGTWRVKYRENGRQFSKNFPTKALASRFDADVKERKVEGRPLARLKDGGAPAGGPLPSAAARSTVPATSHPGR